MTETARTRQDRAEGLYGGAPKRCYGKSGCRCRCEKAAGQRLF